MIPTMRFECVLPFHKPKVDGSISNDLITKGKVLTFFKDSNSISSTSNLVPHPCFCGWNLVPWPGNNGGSQLPRHPPSVLPPCSRCSDPEFRTGPEKHEGRTGRWMFISILKKHSLWRFPEMGVPLADSSMDKRDFPWNKEIIYCADPSFMETSICGAVCGTVCLRALESGTIGQPCFHQLLLVTVAKLWQNSSNQSVIDALGCAGWF